MDKYIHKNLAEGRWKEFTFFEQMANIGTDVARAVRWKEEKNKEYCSQAFERAIELLDLTIEDSKNKSRWRELLRLREVLADYFIGDNEYASSPSLWDKYFLPFNFAARINC